MFLVILLLVVLLSISVKEGLEAEQKAGELYENYGKMEKSFQEYNDKFKSLVM